MPAEINYGRRRFFDSARMTLGAARLDMSGSVQAQSRTKPGANTSPGELKQIDAGVLNVDYAEAGPVDGPAVILLHGWPYRWRINLADGAR